ncbi:hypothetical protein X566_20980 [Afipia sp. P52-10]|nr:hypothetical protein X566_20980 [Afipia sp. P52-10]
MLLTAWLSFRLTTCHAPGRGAYAKPAILTAQAMN